MHICLKVHKNEKIGNTKLKFFSSWSISYNKQSTKFLVFNSSSAEVIWWKWMFFVVFRLLNINISAHRIENIERCKHYSASLILFGLKIVVLCSGEYVVLLKWKFWKCRMEMLIPYYSWSQGSALLHWTHQKLLVDFCQGNVAAGAVPHTIPSHFNMTARWGKWNSAVWVTERSEPPHGCCPALSPLGQPWRFLEGVGWHS